MKLTGHGASRTERWTERKLDRVYKPRDGFDQEPAEIRVAPAKPSDGDLKRNALLEELQEEKRRRKKHTERRALRKERKLDRAYESWVGLRQERAEVHVDPTKPRDEDKKKNTHLEERQKKVTTEAVWTVEIDASGSARVRPAEKSRSASTRTEPRHASDAASYRRKSGSTNPPEKAPSPDRTRPNPVSEVAASSSTGRLDDGVVSALKPLTEYFGYEHTLEKVSVEDPDKLARAVRSLPPQIAASKVPLLGDVLTDRLLVIDLHGLWPREAAQVLKFGSALTAVYFGKGMGVMRAIFDEAVERKGLPVVGTSGHGLGTEPGVALVATWGCHDRIKKHLEDELERRNARFVAEREDLRNRQRRQWESNTASAGHSVPGFGPAGRVHRSHEPLNPPSAESVPAEVSLENGRRRWRARCPTCNKVVVFVALASNHAPRLRCPCGSVFSVRKDATRPRASQQTSRPKATDSDTPPWGIIALAIAGTLGLIAQCGGC